MKFYFSLRAGFIMCIAGLLILSRPVQSQSVGVIKWKEVEAILTDPADSLSVINFWATWCKPCVKEIPHFEEVRKANSGKPVRFIYISLDFSQDRKTRLEPFVQKRMPGARVWLLDETDYNSWIDKVDPNWGGSIPVTLFLNNAKKIRIFAPSDLSHEQLVRNIESSL